MSFPSFKCIRAVLLILSGMYGSNNAFAQPYSWTNLPDFIGLERDDAVAFSIDKTIYLGSGNHGGFAQSNYFYAFDIEKGAWRSVSAFPGVARQYAAVEVVNERAYLIGGIDLFNNPLNDCWVYDSRTNTWTEMSSVPANPRWQAVSFVLNDQIYYGTGRDWTLFYKDFWQYSLKTDEWLRLSDLPDEPSYERVAFSVANHGYIGLGRDCTGVFIPSFLRYNDVTDQWFDIGTFPGTPRYYASATQLGSEAVVCAGQSEAGLMLKDAWVFDPLEETWKEINSGFEAGIRGQSSCYIPFYGAFFCLGLNEDFERSAVVSVLRNNRIYDDYNNLFYNHLNGFIYIDGLDVNSVLTVYSILGDLVVDQRVSVEMIQLSTADWAKGVYLVSVNERTKKIVVH